MSSRTVASRAGATLNPNPKKMSKAKIVLPEVGLLKLVTVEGKGRGVVANRPIKKGKLIEAGPIIRMKKKDKIPKDCVLSNYPFEWDDKPWNRAFPLGWAGLLNHSDKPNCKIECNIEGEVLEITAIKSIAKGEELVWDYGIKPWFDVK